MRKLLLFVSFASLALLGGSFCRFSRHSTPELILIEQQGKVGYIDPKGKLVIPAVYDNGSDFSEGLAAVREGGYYGYIDTKGHFVILPQFDWAEPFSEGLAAVHAGSRFFYIDRSGTAAFRSPYTALCAFQHGVAMVKTVGGHWGLVNHRGRLVLDTLYNFIRDFDEGLAFVQRDGPGSSMKEGVIDTLGRLIIPVGKYERVDLPHHGYCVVSDGVGLETVMDHNGTELFQRSEKNLSSIEADKISEGVAPVMLYKYWDPPPPEVMISTAKAYEGYLDLQGKILLNDTLIGSVTPFLHGRAFIRPTGGDWRLIDRNLQRVGKDEYSWFYGPGFTHDHAIVTLNGSEAVIDTNSHILFRSVDFGAQSLSFLGDRFVVEEVVSGDTTRYGVRTITGKSIYPPRLDQYDLNGFRNGVLKVMLRGRPAVVDTTGRVIWRDSSTTSSVLRPLHIDYMLRGYFNAYSAPDARGGMDPSGGWAVSHNVPRKIDRPFDANMLQIVIDTSVVDTFSGAYRGYRVYLANTTKDTSRFDAEDSRLYLSTEAQGPDGSWKAIDYLPNSWCGNSYHTVDLDPGAYWRFTMPQFDGAIPVNLRLRLERKRLRENTKPVILYSNVIRSHVNPAQFWNKRPYTPRGIMDPYNE